MAARRGIVTGGTWCVDRNKLVEFWPAEDGIAEILAVETGNGGSASNLAIDIKRLAPDLPVETIGLVGNDEDGRFLLAAADAHGIDRRQIAITDEVPTQYTDAFGSRRSGRRTHIYFPGTAALLTPDHFDLQRTTGRIFHLGLPGVHRKMDAAWGDAENGWVAVLRKAKASGLETNLELPSIDRDFLARLVRPCLPHLDYLIVNDHEIGAIAGEQTLRDGRADIEACLRAARRLLAAGPMRLIVVHFPLGAVVACRDGTVLRRPSVRVPASEVAAANGAGDAFAAGMVYGLHEAWSIEDAISLAHATAAASLRAVSTTGSVESWQACLELAKKWGWRDPI
jgi:sugar/nucleoside kinase (ribokinase family)